MRKAYAAIDALHADRVLLILVETREDIEQLSFADLRNELDHFIEDNGCLFPDLRCLVLRDRVIHCHQFLLRCWCHLWVNTREKLNCSEF